MDCRTCGDPVWIKKTGECKRCYRARYYREHKTEPKPRAKLSDEERRQHAVESATRWRAAHHDQSIAIRAAYRERNRERIRQRDAERRKSRRAEVEARRERFPAW